MTMFSLYSLIAVCTLAIALAAQTKSLWRVGLLFSLNWAMLIFINMDTLPTVLATPQALVTIYTANTLLNLKFYIHHKCHAGLAIAAVQILCVTFGGYSQDTLNSVSINFVLSSLIIIAVSLSHVLPVELKNHRVRAAKHKTEKENPPPTMRA